MTSLLTSISGQFGRAIVLGILFPVLIVSILNDLITVPLLPFGPALQTQLIRIATGEDKWAAVFLVFVAVVVSGFLYNLNIPIIRLYEGYPWKASWPGQLWSWRKRELFRRVGALRLSLRYLRRQLGAVDPNNTLLQDMQSEQNDLARFINSELPDREDLILPTRFGNVIRCFERYSDVAYGMDAIVLWPRLVAKIETGFASTIDEAKTSVDFMVNSSFLCGLSGVAVGLIGLLTGTPWSFAFLIHWAWRSALFLGLAMLFYAFAIGRAKAWGEQVKSAFDLYRFDLLKSLGYQQQPSTYFEEKALWHRISVQLLYADAREKPLLYKAGPTRVSAGPVGIQLEINKSVVPAVVSGSMRVEIAIENKDRKPTDFVVLSETIPDGYKFMADSVRVSAGDLAVTNVAPPELRLGGIAPGSRIIVTYTMKSIAT